MTVLVGIGAFLTINYGGVIKSFLYPPTDKVNILVLGKGGVGHEAPDLTDTIILTSISKKKIVLVSLPRDIWVSEIRAKLNSAYFYGKLPLAKTSVERIAGVPVKYGVVIDFSGFKGMIDVLGGIEVDVKNSFIDEKYPVPGKENDTCLPCRYETIRFTQGKQIMNGETALKFVRSRNAEGDEGTDIAREARQQQVIGAIRNKVLSPEVFLNLNTIIALRDAVYSSIETDMDTNTIAGLVRLFLSARNSIESKLIPDDLLENPPSSKKYDNQYVFIAKSGDWSEVEKWIKEVTD